MREIKKNVDKKGLKIDDKITYIVNLLKIVNKYEKYVCMDIQIGEYMKEGVS